MRTRALTLVCLLAATTGCYKATIETGLQPSGESIKNEWAHSFIAGLVPPSTVETASRCPNGVARVQTQLSFLNMVANAVTFGIYSPMTIEVQCAAAREDSAEYSAALVVPARTSADQAARVFDAAANMSLEQNKPVLVRFE
jgi:hypothetical protein